MVEGAIEQNLPGIVVAGEHGTDCSFENNAPAPVG